MKIQLPHMNMNKDFRFLFILLLLIFIVITVSFKLLINEYGNQVTTLNESNESIRKNHISTMVLYAYEVANKQADDVAERLTIQIKDAYPDLSVLENELNSGNLDDTKIMRIIYDEIGHAELFNMSNPNNHLVVFLEDDYVFDNQIRKYGKPYHRFGEDQELDSKYAFDTFLTGAISKDNHIFYSKSDNKYPSDKRMIMAINQEEFYNQILNDLDNLNNYEVYAVAYITSEGDIFGHMDVTSELKRNITHKIIVVQSFNVNDVLLAKNDSSYKEAMKYNETLNKQLRDHMFLHSFSFIIIFILFLFSTLLSFFLFMTDKKCSKCVIKVKERIDKEESAVNSKT